MKLSFRLNNKLPPQFRELLAIFISVIAIVVSIWSVNETRTIARRTEISEFQLREISRLEAERKIYSHAQCILRASKLPEAELLDAPIAHIDGLIQSFASTSPPDLKAKESFESKSQSGHIKFLRLEDQILKFKSKLSTDELDRANKVCGS